MPAGLPCCSSRSARSCFRSRRVARTTPQAAGFPEAEEHVLTTADGEKVIVWHVPAKPGHPVVLYFHGNGDFLAGFFGRFRDMIADGTGVVALSYRGYAGSSGQPSERGLLRMPRRPMPLRGAIQRGQDRRLGLFARHRRRGGAGGGSAGRQADPGSALYVDRGCGRVAFLVRADALVMRDPFRSDRRIARVKVPLLVMHGARDPAIPIRFGERCLRWRMSQSNSSGSRKAATTIWTIMARLKWRDISSMLQRADGCLGLAHSPFRDSEDVIMSAHGPMPRSAWIFPALAVLFFAVRHRARAHIHAFGRRAGVCGGAAGDPVRHRVRGRAPRRGDRRADRRALWHAAADAGGHHHRGRADRDHHARRKAGAGAGARHRVRGGDDRLQRPRRHLHLDRRLALPRAGFSGLRLQPVSQRAVRAGDDHADHAQLYADHAGADLFGGPTRFCQRRHAHSLRRVSLYPDHPASRLFHQRVRRRRG